MKLRHLALPAILAAVLGNPAAIASPAIQDVVVDPAQEALVVLGRGFGEKPQAGPVLFDFGSYAYENGGFNDFHSTHYVDGQNMRPTFMDSNMRIYDNMGRVPRNTAGAGPIYVNESAAQRHAGVGALYRMRSGARIGQPMAYGGYANPDDRRFTQPDGEKQAYAAFWIKHWHHPTNSRALRLSDINGDFLVSADGWGVGERFTISGMSNAGYVIGWWEGKFDNDPSGSSFLHLDVAFDGQPPPLSDRGRTITGVTSGATATIDTSVIHHGSQKYMRIWQGWPSCPDTRTRATLSLQTLGQDCGTWMSGWHISNSRAIIQPDTWHLFEVTLDNEVGQMAFRIDGKPIMLSGHNTYLYSYDPAIASSMILSPTLHTLGMDTNSWGRHTFDISEVYFDNTLQRVMIADARTLADAKHLELQRPISWVDDQVAFELRLGAFQGTRTADELYVFVFDRNGQANAEGFPLSADPMGLIEPVLPPPDPISVN